MAKPLDSVSQGNTFLKSIGDAMSLPPMAILSLVAL